MTKNSDSITKVYKYHLNYNFGMIIGEVDLLYYGDLDRLLRGQMMLFMSIII